jgi:PIN domain nuclease of toxin-antitoxin system
MRILIDTHFLLWSILDSEKLTSREKQILSDAENNEIYISPISFLEISLKYSIKSLHLKGVTPDMFPELAAQVGFEVLPLTSIDYASFHHLPKMEHSDPFDRIRIWQAIQNRVHMMSRDAEFDHYKAHGLILV